MKVGQGHFLTLFFFQVLYVLCFTRPRYQVSVYRTIGPLVFFLYGIIQFEQHVPFRVFLSVTSDRKVQCPRVGLEVKIYDTPAGGIRASQGTFF